MENAFTKMLRKQVERFVTVFSFSIYLIVASVTVNVICRYAFNNPLMYIAPINKQLFAIFILIGGIYVTSEGEHIRVQVFSDHFSRGMKIFSKIVGLCCFLIFIIILIWQSTWLGLNSFESLETTGGLERLPIYPLKLFIPFVAVLILFEGVLNFLRIWKDDSY